MISLEGIVTKCSLVRPKVVKSVHYNEKKNIFHFREYRDQTMTANGAASTSVYPQEDEDGNKVLLQFGENVRRNAKLLSADHRIWLLHVQRSSDDINTRDARASARRAATSRC